MSSVPPPTVPAGSVPVLAGEALALFEHLAVPVLAYALGEDGRPGPFHFVNDAALRLYGYSRAEMLGMTSFDLVDTAVLDLPGAIETIRSAQSAVVPSMHIASDGRRIPVEVHAHYVLMDGRPTIFGLCRDVSDRRRAEEALQDRERRLADTLESINDTFIALDHDCTITHVNRRAAATVGKAPEALVGRNIFETYPAYHGTALEQAAREALATGEPVSVEAFSPVTGRWVEGTFYPTPEGLSVFGRDVSARKQAEATIEASAERLRRIATASLAITRAATLEDKLRAITEEARGIIGAHQAVTSLTLDADWTQAINAVSLSDKYAAYRSYDAPPDGSGIYAAVCRDNRPIRLSQAELEAHPAYRHLGRHAGEHPPLRGWLAVPLVGTDGSNLGLIQLSDRHTGDFTEEDESVLVQFAQFASSVVEAARAERAHAEAAERFRTLAEAMPQKVFLQQPHGRAEYLNHRWTTYLQIPQDELLTTDWSQFVHPDDLARNHDRWHEALASGSEYEVEHRIRGADGTYRWHLTRALPVRTPEGGAPLWVGSSTDIHDLKATEQALRDSEARYRALVEATAAIVWTAGPEGTSETPAPAWEVLTGQPPTDAVRLGWIDAVHPDDRETARAEWAAAHAERRPLRMQYRLRHRDGAYRHVLVLGIPLLDADGALTEWIGTVTDIDERVRTTEALEALNATLERRVAERTAVAERQARQLRRLAAELTRAEQRERRRLATTLHDHLQQLLVAAKLRLDVVAGRLAADAPGLAGQIDELLDQAIDVSRSLSVQLSPPVLRDAGLGPALEWLARWMQDKHNLSVDLRVERSAEPQDEHVRVVLFEAARELLFNVTKHARTTAARVTLAPQEPAHLHLLIEDDGVGFDAAHPDRAQGLGLRNIRERLSYVGGSLDLASGPSQGTRVRLLAPLHALPSSPLSVAPDEPFALSGAPDATAMSAASPIRVLLADDHRILREGLASLLSEAEGITVVGEAEDGQHAVELARELKPDVIVMDVTMTRMSGIEATRIITAEQPEVRVIGLSMHSEADMAEALREAGAQAYLTKGGPARSLVEAIRQAGARPEA